MEISFCSVEILHQSKISAKMRCLAVFNLFVLICGISADVEEVGDHFILTPNNSTSNDEVGIILIPGAYLTNDQYIQFGEALQEASPYKLWVGIVGGFLEDLPNPLQLKEKIRTAMDAFYFLGMDTNEIFLAGHSLGGSILEAYGENPEQPIRGILLLASWFSQKAMDSYPVPFLTLSGDLDGETRITKMHTYFKHLESLVQSTSIDYMYQKPVVTLKDVNHAHYATGEMPPRVKEKDILSPLGKEEGQELISSHMMAFMVATLGYPEESYGDSIKLLEDAYHDNAIRMDPITQINRLTKYPDESGCPWTEEAQLYITNFQDHQTNDQRIKRRDRLHTSILFPTATPSLEFNGEFLYIRTHSHTQHVLTDIEHETPDVIQAKMFNQDQIMEIMTDLDLDFLEGLSCADINEIAFNLTYEIASDLVKERYDTRAKQIQFLDDIPCNSDSDWLDRYIVYDETTEGLTVASPVYISSLDAPKDPGMQYCMLMPPSRILEHIMIDSLRHTQPV